MSDAKPQQRSTLAAPALTATHPGCKGTGMGVNPKEWEVKRLGEHVTYLRTGTASRAELITKGLTKYLHYGDIHTSTQVRLNASRKGIPSLHGDLARTLDRLRDGDLVFVDASEDLDGVGKSVEITGTSNTDIVAGLHTIAARFDKSILVDGFKAFLQFCPAFRQHLRRLAAGTKVYATSRGHISSAEVPLPPPHEQSAIAEALSDVDGLLATLDELIAKKQAIKKAAMQQLLTGKTRLPGFSGPWQMKRLGEHVQFLRTGTNSRAELTGEGPVKYLHYGDIHTATYVTLNPMVHVMPCLGEERARALHRLRDGDLVFVDASEDLDGVGKSVEITGAAGIDIVAGLHTIAARLDKSVLANGFKAFLQFCPAFRQHLRRLAAGTKVYATSRVHITSAEVPLPSIDEQTAISTVLSTMDTEIAALERRRDKAHQIMLGMMQQLLTGRIRLIEPAKTVEASA